MKNACFRIEEVSVLGPRVMGHLWILHNPISIALGHETSVIVLIVAEPIAIYLVPKKTVVQIDEGVVDLFFNPFQSQLVWPVICSGEHGIGWVDKYIQFKFWDGFFGVCAVGFH